MTKFEEYVVDFAGEYLSYTHQEMEPQVNITFKDLTKLLQSFGLSVAHDMEMFDAAVLHEQGE